MTVSSTSKKALSSLRDLNILADSYMMMRNCMPDGVT
jgi:hypothetical protein